MVMAHGLNAAKVARASEPSTGGKAANSGGGGGGGIGSRRIFPPHFKLQVLDSYRHDADCKGNQRATARKYGIHRRQIQKWLQAETNLRSTVSAGGQTTSNGMHIRKSPVTMAAAAAAATTTIPDGASGRSSLMALEPQQQQYTRQRDDGEPPRASHCDAYSWPPPQQQQQQQQQSHRLSPVLSPATAERGRPATPVARSPPPPPPPSSSPTTQLLQSEAQQQQQQQQQAPMDLSVKRAAPVSPGASLSLAAQRDRRVAMSTACAHRSRSSRSRSRSPVTSTSSYSTTATTTTSAYSLHSPLSGIKRERTESPSSCASSTSPPYIKRERVDSPPYIKRERTESPASSLASSVSSSCISEEEIWDLSTSGRHHAASLRGGVNTPAPLAPPPQPAVNAAAAAAESKPLFKPYLLDDEQKPAINNNSYAACNNNYPLKMTVSYFGFHSMFDYVYDESGVLQPAAAFLRHQHPALAMHHHPLAAPLPHHHQLHPQHPATAPTLPPTSSEHPQRQTYSVGFKLRAIDSYYNDELCRGNQRAVAFKYNIHRRQVQKWLKQEDELRERAVIT